MYIYLHGFASGPQSIKALYLRDRSLEIGLNLIIPDLNQNDFPNLTLTRQIQQVAAQFKNEPITLIGSSFGGLTAAWLAQKYPQVQRIICLAPAFNFLDYWWQNLGAEKMKQWEQTGTLPVYHSQAKQELPLNYQFIQDLNQYDDRDLQRPVPTLILHGRDDEVIPIIAARNYASDRPLVKLIELESDHRLGNVLPQIWQEIKQCSTNPKYFSR